MTKSIIMVVILAIGLLFIDLFLEKSVTKKYLTYMFFFLLMASGINLVTGIMVNLMNSGKVYIDAISFGYINSVAALINKMLEIISVYYIYLILKSEKAIGFDVELP